MGNIWDVIFALFKWLFQSVFWFVSQMLEGKLPKVMIVAVIVFTILGAALGATMVVNQSVHMYQKAEFLAVIFFAIPLGSLGALIGTGIAYLYTSSRK
jgi:hypothetical protein